MEAIVELKGMEAIMELKGMEAIMEFEEDGGYRGT